MKKALVAILLFLSIAGIFQVFPPARAAPVSQVIVGYLNGASACSARANEISYPGTVSGQYRDTGQPSAVTNVSTPGPGNWVITSAFLCVNNATLTLSGYGYATLFTNLTGTYGNNQAPGTPGSRPAAWSNKIDLASIEAHQGTKIWKQFTFNASQTLTVPDKTDVGLDWIWKANNTNFQDVNLWTDANTGAYNGESYFCASAYLPSSTCQSYTLRNGGSKVNFAFELDGYFVPTVTTEPQKVLFRDDFLYTNNLLESSWSIDSYQNPGVNPGISTSSGYAILKATISGTETAHVTTPIFNPSLYANSTLVKRKMTVAAIPFAVKQVSVTGFFKIGLGPLLSDAGAFPGGYPRIYGIPNSDASSDCAQSNVSNAGVEYFSLDNTGTLLMGTCTDQGTSNKVNLETGLNPTLYSVFTIETAGVFCSVCNSGPNNVFPNTAWVWFRFYQENSAGKIITSTDKNQNFTANIDPYKNAVVVWISQQVNDAGASGQLSKVDFVQIQNFGSPVCLVAPTGALCARLPINPGHLTSDLIGSFAYIATLLGGGDEQAGAIILFLILSAGFAGAPLLITKSFTWALFGENSVLGFFVYAGFLPSWILFLVLLGGAVILVMMVNRLMSGHSMGAVGGPE